MTARGIGKPDTRWAPANAGELRDRDLHVTLHMSLELFDRETADIFRNEEESISEWFRQM